MTHSGDALISAQKIYDKIGLSEGMRVADLGCGRTGHFVFTSSRIVGEKGIVYAVDIMKDVLENIKSRAKSEGFFNIEVVWSDLEKVGSMPVPDKSLDVCFFVNAMFQIKDKASAVAESARLLKKNGFLVIVDWTKRIGLLGPTDDLMTKPDELVKLGQKASLTLKEKGAAGEYHYYLILQKISE